MNIAAYKYSHAAELAKVHDTRRKRKTTKNTTSAYQNNQEKNVHI